MKLYRLTKDFGLALKGDILMYDENVTSYILSTVRSDNSENHSSTQECYMTLPKEVVENNPELFIQVGVPEQPKSEITVTKLIDTVKDRMNNVKETIDVLQQSIQLLGDTDVTAIEDTIESLQKEYWTLEWVTKLV